MYITKHYSR